MNDIRKYEQRLAAAHQSTTPPELDDAWKAGVMQSVRAEVVLPAPSSYFESAVRRAAIAAAILVVVTLGVCLSLGVSSTSELFVLVSSAPESLLELALVF